ncbi:hypothetical protein MKW94_010709 [Papaver nudicaule]|uniref:RRM domain-containing protein n=1 Tax=Papaver nudicaule TaxID=74823 RepID=A0AA41VU23_PAPNU|nr:hypothetical protein [Papaver nudicaule]
MAKEQRVEEDEVDTEPETEEDDEVEQDDAEVVHEEATEEEEEEEDVTKLLEPFSREQLIDIIRSVVSTKNKEIVEEIKKRADQDPSHCELFVHGLSLETTSDQLKEVFSDYGAIGQCSIIVDRNTCKSKGYGFILYKHRKSVSKALKEPVKMIGDRMVRFRLASQQQPQQRKIFVSNVDSEISIMKLYSYFLKYGEIEAGPLGYDKYTGKFKGCASFVYKNVEGARRALEEPIKRFAGYTLYCQMAIEDKQKFGPSGVGGFSPYAGVGASFDTQNGVAQISGQGRRLGNGAQPYRQEILTETEQVQAALAILAAAGQNPSTLSALNPSLAGFRILGAFGTENPVCQNLQSHQLNASKQIAPSEHGPAKRHALGYYLKTLGLVFVFLVGFNVSLNNCSLIMFLLFRFQCLLCLTL